jgi:hypothetical protein
MPQPLYYQLIISHLQETKMTISYTHDVIMYTDLYTNHYITLNINLNIINQNKALWLSHHGLLVNNHIFLPIIISVSLIQNLSKTE